MTFVVPFDGSPLSTAALRRAVELGGPLDHQIHTVTVVPIGDAEYAVDRGWLDQGAAFDDDAVESGIREQIHDVAPDATVHLEAVDRYATAGTISNRIRTVAREIDATIVFIGSENAGEIVNSVSSVGSSVAASDAYDVFIVRHGVEQ